MQTIVDLFQNNQAFFTSLGVGLLVWAVFWLAGTLLRRALFPFLTGHVNHEKHPHVSILLNGFERPLSVYLKVMGLCVFLMILAQYHLVHAPDTLTTLMNAAPSFLTKTMRVITILAITWGLLGSSDIAGLFLRNAKNKLDVNMSRSALRFLSGVFKIIVVAIAVVVLLSEFDYDINGLVASLGLGGLTIALAAKDSASNFFGGLVLVTEKPFEIGDWIVSGTVEGTVEDINMRSTSVRTAPGALTIVPNAQLSGSAITNWSGGMQQRRADLNLHVEYGTPPDALKKLVGSIRDMLDTDEEIDSDSILVRFSEFADSGYEIRVIFNTTLPGLDDHMRIRERINYTIIDLMHQYKVVHALTSETIYIRRDDGNSVGK